MTLPPIDHPRVPWRARMLRKAGATRATTRHTPTKPALDGEWFDLSPYRRSNGQVTAEGRVLFVEAETLRGRTPEQILEALGVTLNTLVRLLERSTRPDLASPYRKLLRHQRAEKCACGAVVDRRIPDCRACGAGRAA